MAAQATTRRSTRKSNADFEPEILLYGIPAGEIERYTEELLYTKAKTKEDIERVKAVAAKDGFHSFRVTTFDGTPPDFTKVLGKRRGKRGNPDSDAAGMYESFHGSPSENIEEFIEQEHYHGNLAELGVLVGLKVRTVNGEDVTVKFSEGVNKTGSNPSKTFIVQIPGSLARKKFSNESSAEKYALKLAKENYTFVPVMFMPTGGTFPIDHVWIHPDGTREARSETAKRRTASNPFWPFNSFTKTTIMHVGTGDKLTAKGTHKGYTVYQDNKTGEFAIPAIERESRFDTKRDATRFIDSWVKARANGGPIGKAVGGFYGAAKKVGGYLDGQLGKVLNPPKLKSKLDLYLDAVVSGKRGEITFDVQDGYTEEQKNKIIKAAESRGLDASSDGKYILIRNLRQGNPSGSPSITLLCSNESGNQLYLVGGDQETDLSSLQIPAKDSVVIGEVWGLAYETQKDFDQFQDILYAHQLGDEKHIPKIPRGGDVWDDMPPPEKLFGSGELPTLIYDNLNHRLSLSGGIYKIERPMFETSAGIEN